MSQYASFSEGGLPDKLQQPSEEWVLDFYGESAGPPPDPGRVRIDGSILAVTGLCGLVTGRCTAMFDPESVTVMVGNASNQVRLHYSDITSLQVGGRGDVVTTSGGGWTGRGRVRAGRVHPLTEWLSGSCRSAIVVDCGVEQRVAPCSSDEQVASHPALVFQASLLQHTS